ncbi:hypothetical protein [Bradyrhizobium yuanmingense]|uniref:hypothetical protein n=1 Tax=Bradyrhizobium yuanmingense TaxID=108015 RepID=UPI0023B93169|nr:hypothetical protein [Bradyrhizobium yuanmingense]MDF0581274.1 hypothetical protein [Bradyrhizobium yuanmingense]
MTEKIGQGATGADQLSPQLLIPASLARAILPPVVPPELRPCERTCSQRGAHRRTAMQLAAIGHPVIRRQDGHSMKITSVEKHVGSGQWFGEAAHEGKRYKWYYQPRRRLNVHEQDKRNPYCWMVVEPPLGAREAVLRAIRAAKVA